MSSSDEDENESFSILKFGTQPSDNAPVFAKSATPRQPIKKKRPVQLDTDDHFRDVIVKMMFTYGDSAFPLENNMDTCVDVVKYQLVKMCDDAYTFSRAAGRSTIEVCDLVLLLRRHRHLLTRLLNYCKTAQHLTRLNTDASGTCIEEGDDVGEGLLLDDNVPTACGGDDVYDAVAGAVNEQRADLRAVQLELLPDPLYESRRRRLAVRAKKLTSQLYAMYADARTAHFVSRNPLKRVSSSARFLSWLGSPPLSTTAVFVLAFLARETIAELVDDAYLLAQQEWPGSFSREGASDALQVRHYEEALRRNLGFRQRGDLLLGYF